MRNARLLEYFTGVDCGLCLIHGRVDIVVNILYAAVAHAENCYRGVTAAKSIGIIKICGIRGIGRIGLGNPIVQWDTAGGRGAVEPIPCIVIAYTNNDFADGKSTRTSVANVVVGREDGPEILISGIRIVIAADNSIAMIKPVRVVVVSSLVVWRQR